MNHAEWQRALLQRLESLAAAGVEQIPRVRLGKAVPTTLPATDASMAVHVTASPMTTSPAPVVRAATAPSLPPPTIQPPVQEPAMPRAKSTPVVSPIPSTSSLSGQPYSQPVPKDPVARGAALQLINDEVCGCRLCPELARARKQTVFGVGTPTPRVVFFGEAPGADEDEQGEPFVGRAGQLLTKIIEACTWKRSDVYILNTLKCRPPGNRNPEPKELANCRPFWERQLDVLQPEYIVCVGTFAAQTLLESTEPIGKLRGKFYRYRGSIVIATYHPSYLLRNPPAKAHVWDDMKMLLKKMGISIPATKS